MDTIAASRAHSLKGEVSQLLPVLPEDLPFVYSISTCEENGFRWRYRGSFPDIAAFAQEYNAGTLVQFIVQDRSSGRQAGIVNIYGENLRDGWAYLGAVAAPEFQHTGVVVDGAATLLSYAFNVWALRKVYLDTIEYNMAEFEVGLRRISVEESRLKDHIFFGGRYWDMVTSAVYRERWYDLVSRVSAPRRPANAVCQAIPFDDFKAELLEVVGDEDAMQDSRLVSDLGMDSLQMAEAIAIVCSLAEVDGVDADPEVVTLGEFYDWYCRLL
ncbi:MAG: GNAT family N-acetyltransferase [Microthrixaceae bacterium]